MMNLSFSNHSVKHLVSKTGNLRLCPSIYIYTCLPRTRCTFADAVSQCRHETLYSQYRVYHRGDSTLWIYTELCALVNKTHASASDLKYLRRYRERFQNLAALQRRYLCANFITVVISVINLIIYMKTLPMTQRNIDDNILWRT